MWDAACRTAQPVSIDLVDISRKKVHTRRLTVRQLPQLLDALARHILGDDISNRQVSVKGLGRKEAQRDSGG